MKQEQFDYLIDELGKCKECINFQNCEKSLINIYQDKDFSKNIPSIWTDWFNRFDSKIMLIGQDWGPYYDMQKYHNLLKKDKSNWKEIIELEKK